MEVGAVHVGLFGGSFDPPHICHALFCVYVLGMTDVEKVLWVPCVDHPFGKANAPYEHRLAMSRLAAQSLGPRVEVSEMEGRMPRPSYTINTVEALRRQLPAARISILIGSDLEGEIDQWERIEELRRLSGFIVVPRGEAPTRAGALAVALPDVSSSAVRDALREGRSVEGVLIPAVRSYIEEHGLYRT